MAIPRNLANIAPHVNASSTELVVNDGGANLDFRVEGDTNANLLFVDAGAGLVGVGTNTPASNTGTALVVYDTSNPRIRLTNSTTGQASSDGSEILIDGSDLYIENRETGNIIFYRGSERARIASTGELLVGKTAVTANGGVLQVSNGITFPATQSACSDVNTLDDYEEGTWTPTVSRTGSSYVFGDNANGYRTGKYVKIGNTVYCWFSLSINSISTQGSGGNSLSGLPFASSGGAFARFSGSVSVCLVLPTATSLFLGGNTSTSAGFANQSNEGLSSDFTTGNVFGFISYQAS